MPEQPQEKIRPHPRDDTWAPVNRKRTANSEQRTVRTRVASSLQFAELLTTSNFSFLRGASHPEELVEQAAALGYAGIAVTDRNSVAGIVRGHVAAKKMGLPYVVGAELVFDEPAGLSIAVYPTDRASYGRLCRLLTVGKRRAEKGQCILGVHDLLEHQAGLLAIVVPPRVLDGSFLELLRGLRRFDDDRLSLAASFAYDGDDRQRLERLATLADHVRVPLAASCRAAYHVPRRRALHDVLACIRAGCTLGEAGYRLAANAERHLKTPQEMTRLFGRHASAMTRTAEIATRAGGFSLDQIRYEYPREVCPPGRSPIEHLTDLAWQGAAGRYVGGVPDKVKTRIRHELALIDELSYASYFLTVHDLVEHARSRGILCQGRGAAANSAVCYCLGVTAVDPDRIDLLFERFVSRERDEPPDIDIDFEHERREEVIQYIYGKYGRDRAALTAEVISYRGRSAIREVGKVLGLSLDCVDRLSRDLDWWQDRVLEGERLRDIGLDPADPTMRRFVHLVNDILGFPRHLSQHVGGFVITRGPLCEIVPVENAAMPDRTVIEWDKDDIDAMGMMKVDVLGLGMLTCIRKAFGFVNETLKRRNVETSKCLDADQHENDGRSRPRSMPSSDQEKSPSQVSTFRRFDVSTFEPLQLHTVPPEDPVVYDMICKADTIGVFQIESRAQMSMLPRLQPRCFYDLVIEVAIVRPGPIQGDMVHPYLRRRNGEEPVSFPSEAVKKVLARTLGVPLFQEQAMALAMVAAGFTAGEADQLRRAMAAWKRRGDDIERFGRRLVSGMIERGYDEAFAGRCFAQIRGFSEYGFPESHAASFALLVYVSCWLKRHHPAAFAAALINSQPMGFYAPAQIVQDALTHGVEVREVDVNRSTWDCTLENVETSKRRNVETGPGQAIRLGMRLIKGLREEHADAVASVVRDHGPFDCIETLWRRADVPIGAMRRLARADAFRSMGLDRQGALWHVQALRADTLPMFESVPPRPGPPPPELPVVSPVRRVMHDYESTHLSLKAHPVSFLREGLDAEGVIRAERLADAADCPVGRVVTVAGIALVRQRPSTAAGIVFMTLEDETGIANLIVRPPIYRRYRRAARHGIILLARGRIERQGEVVHVLVQSIRSLDTRMRDLEWTSRDFR